MPRLSRFFSRRCRHCCPWVASPAAVAGIPLPHCCRLIRRLIHQSNHIPRPSSTCSRMDSAEAAAPAAAPVGLGPVVPLPLLPWPLPRLLLRVRILLGFIHFADEVLQLGRSRNSVGQVVRRYFRAFPLGCEALHLLLVVAVRSVSKTICLLYQTVECRSGLLGFCCIASV